MQRYGENFVIYIANDNTKNKYGRRQLLEKFMSFISGTRQPELTKKDIEEIKSLPNRRYAYTSRQYTGHKYKPSAMQGGDRIFVGRTVVW